MKVVKEVPPPHPCTTLLWDFYNRQSDDNGVPTLGIGSIVECDCGSQYTLSDSQLDGKFWMKRTLRELAGDPVV